MIFKQQAQGGNGNNCSYCKMVNCSCGSKHSANDCGCKKSASSQQGGQSKESKNK